MTFDAVVLATGPYAHNRVLGLTLAERGERVAAKVGARRVLVLDQTADLAVWDAERGDAALLVIDAREHLVHVPLVERLVRASGPRRVAVDAEGRAAGALWLDGAAPLDALARGELPTAGAEPVPHGAIARHLARTPSERRGAARMLEQILIKAEDSPIVRLFYRPLSRPITRLLLHTPVTPNQVSIVVLALGVLGWTGYARLARAEIAALRRREFVEAAEALGAGPGRIVVRHLLPLAAPALLVQATFGLGGAIVAEASLSFLGLGAPPPLPSWGSMIYEGRPFLLVAPQLVLWPGVALATAVLALQLLGDGLRDLLDVRDV